MNPKFCPRRAVEADIPQIMTVIEDARRRLFFLGIDQWQDGYPDEAAIRNDIEKGCGWVIDDSELPGPAAYAAIVKGPDPYYAEIKDGSWLYPDEPYLVIHRICVRDGRTNRGLAARLIQQASLLAAREGVNLRIDTHPDNLRMQHLAASAGFVRCGIVQVRDGARIAYELHIR